MEGRDVARFARELRERIEERGAVALDGFDWAAPRGGGGQNSSRIELRSDGRYDNVFVSGRTR